MLNSLTYDGGCEMKDLKLNQVGSPRIKCDHRFVYEGIRYAEGQLNNPGGSARTRYYARAYFCQRCLERQFELMGAIGDSYEPLRYDATLGTMDQVGVPKHDRTRY
jgi:hypothetical protein